MSEQAFKGALAFPDREQRAREAVFSALAHSIAPIVPRDREDRG